MSRGYWYLGSPYSKYPHGLHMAYMAACAAVGQLIQAGHAVYCPIAHFHSVAQYSWINPLDHDMWLPANQPLLDAAKGLIVLKLEGWDKSYGLAYEIEIFTAMGLPVVYMEPGAIPEGL